MLYIEDADARPPHLERSSCVWVAQNECTGFCLDFAVFAMVVTGGCWRSARYHAGCKWRVAACNIQQAVGRIFCLKCTSCQVPARVSEKTSKSCQKTIHCSQVSPGDVERSESSREQRARSSGGQLESACENRELPKRLQVEPNRRPGAPSVAQKAP